MDCDSVNESEVRTKQRRLRTTQSCLNCHTSKRKCDRKRPCTRCVSLGLTGLCVYENDDLAARDDPNIDELTRCRNRITELEAVVRELRGRPHPRWADPGGRRVSHFKHTPRGTDPFEGLTALSDSSNDSSEGMYQDFMKAEYDGVDPSFTVGSRASSSRSPSAHPSTPVPSSYVDGPILGSPLMSAACSPYYFRAGGTSTDMQKCTAHCSSIGPVSAELESLSFQLQKALAVLGPQHGSTDNCHVLRRISELRDALSALTPNPGSSHHEYKSRSHTASSESSLAHALSYPPTPESARQHDARHYMHQRAQPILQQHHPSTHAAFVSEEEWYNTYALGHPHSHLPLSPPTQHALYPTYGHGTYTHMSP